MIVNLKVSVFALLVAFLAGVACAQEDCTFDSDCSCESGTPKCEFRYIADLGNQILTCVCEPNSRGTTVPPQSTQQTSQRTTEEPVQQTIGPDKPKPTADPCVEVEWVSVHLGSSCVRKLKGRWPVYGIPGLPAGTSSHYILRSGIAETYAEYGKTVGVNVTVRDVCSVRHSCAYELESLGNRDLHAMTTTSRTVSRTLAPSVHRLLRNLRIAGHLGDLLEVFFES